MKIYTNINKLLNILMPVILASVIAAPVLAETAPEVTEAELKVSFWDMPYLEQPFIDTSPKARQDNIRVGKLGIDGGDKKAIVNFAKDLATQKYGQVDSFLIAQKNKLLFESYYLRGRVDLPHMQASATKSYTSLAIGRAIQLGYLTMADLDRPVIDFLKELDKSKLVKGAETITLHQALTMSTGMRISREQLKQFEENAAPLKGQAQVQTYLQNSPEITPTSQSFQYTNTDPHLVMQVLAAVVPGSAQEFIKHQLMDKMGIDNYQWHDDVSGLPQAPYRSSMTSRNMLKWGLLIMNNGKWNGEQLIPESYIAKATNRIVQLGEKDIFFTAENITKPGYGYYFWQADMQVGDRSFFTRSAQGGGGQYIVMVDELDLVVVFTAHERDDRTMKMTADRVLPAFAKQTD